jgi:hypothetical protein
LNLQAWYRLNSIQSMAQVFLLFKTKHADDGELYCPANKKMHTRFFIAFTFFFIFSSDPWWSWILQIFKLQDFWSFFIISFFLFFWSLSFLFYSYSWLILTFLQIVCTDVSNFYTTLFISTI